MILFNISDNPYKNVQHRDNYYYDDEYYDDQFYDDYYDYDDPRARQKSKRRQSEVEERQYGGGKMVFVFLLLKQDNAC